MSIDPGLAVELGPDDRQKYIDPQIELNYRTSKGAAKRENLLLKTSILYPPEIVRPKDPVTRKNRGGPDVVYELALDARLLNPGFRPETVIAYRAGNNSVGNVSLVGLVEHSRASIAAGELRHVSWPEDEVVLLQSFTSGEHNEYNAATVGVFLVPEGKSLQITEKESPMWQGINQYQVTYRPPELELQPKRQEREWDFGGEDDEGGSVREPRNPILPTGSGYAEVTEPETEDIDQADAVMPFRETG